MRSSGTMTLGTERTRLLAAETQASPMDLVEFVGGSMSQSGGKLAGGISSTRRSLNEAGDSGTLIWPSMAV
jgi:hypothetical protein